VHCKHICKSHLETPVCNKYMQVKIQKMVLVIVTQHHESIKCQWTVNLKMDKMMTFVSFIICHNKNAKMCESTK
jgi:hypothetical protein